MKIGILTRNNISTTNVTVNGIPTTYLDIIKEKCYPVFIDSTLNLNKYQDDILTQIKNVDGFLLPGGESISEVDLFIIDYCYINDIPLLGICLGMQEISYYFNKSSLILIGNLSHFDMNAKYLHTITINDDSYLKNLLKTDSIKVNSRHKYQISPHDKYTIQATSDKTIEAIKVKDRKYIFGVQFHPEIMYTYDYNAKLIFDDFINQIYQNSKFKSI